MPGSDKCRRLGDVGLAEPDISGYARGSWSIRTIGRQRLRPAWEARLPGRNKGLPQCKSYVGNRYLGGTRQRP